MGLGQDGTGWGCLCVREIDYGLDLAGVLIGVRNRRQLRNRLLELVLWVRRSARVPQCLSTSLELWEHRTRCQMMVRVREWVYACVVNVCTCAL